jgi:hypothetical protein
MHPILGYRPRLFLYLGTWIFVGILLGLLFHLSDPRPWSWTALFLGPLTLLYAFVCLSAWWVCRSFPISKANPIRMVFVLAVTALTSAVMWVAIGGAWNQVTAALFADPFRTPGGTGRIEAHPRDMALLLASGISLYCLSTVGHYLILAFEASRVAERRAYESEVTAREAQVRALRAQLNPHFLFNSLNSINALVGSSPEAARRMCEGLGDFLRQTLSLGARESVTLGEELRLIEKYLSIEKVRFGTRLSSEVVTDPGAEACLVPPLLLQPLVENAVKHGVADRIEGGRIRIDATREGGNLRIRVANPRDAGSPSRRGEGMGIENVRRRLAALDSGKARLEVERRTEEFVVVLELPATEAS